MSEKILRKQDIPQRLNLQDQVRMDDGGGVTLRPQGKVIRKDAFEASEEAQRIIHEAKEEAQRIRTEAQQILDRVILEREEAIKQGYHQGKEEGMSLASEMITKITHEREKLIATLEPEVIRLVDEIAEKIIGRALVEKDTTVVDLVRQALLSSFGSKILLLVNPDDFDVLRKHQSTLMQVLETSQTLQIRPDDRVSPKGCIIETEVGTIDARLETQLAAVRRALGLEKGLEHV